jgi:hypothetical protein
MGLFKKSAPKPRPAARPQSRQFVSGRDCNVCSGFGQISGPGGVRRCEAPGCRGRTRPR